MRAGARERTGNHVRRTERPEETLLRPPPGVSGLPEEAGGQDNTSLLLGLDGVQRSSGGTMGGLRPPSAGNRAIGRTGGAVRMQPPSQPVTLEGGLLDLCLRIQP